MINLNLLRSGKMDARQYKDFFNSLTEEQLELPVVSFAVISAYLPTPIIQECKIFLKRGEAQGQYTDLNAKDKR